jgi:UDP-3-O-[3-hydroxymyristoyl] glucosamine N-acyltransferase
MSIIAEAVDAAEAGIALERLAAASGATLEGNGDVRITRVAMLDAAGPDAIAFVASPRYRSQLDGTLAAAVIVPTALANATSLPRLLSSNPYATYARVAQLLYAESPGVPGAHPSAVVDSTASIAASATIGPHAVIGRRARVGERVRIGAGCSVGDGTAIGDDTRLAANVTVYHGCSIGERCIVHSGAVIGADGFGMAEDAGRWIKIPQVGAVVIGADVEIGANTTIDRGAIGDTVIEDDVKLDNQIQVAHNCHIGAHTAIAGCVGIAGSARIGRNCKIGGAAMIAGHLTIADNVTISGATQVYDPITEPGVYTAAYPALPHREWRHVASEMRRLRSLAQRVRRLEHQGDAVAGKPQEDET